MGIYEALFLLESHNIWRKGDKIEMKNPELLSQAINIVSIELKNYLNQK
jgi:hypothetical protein